MKCSRAKIKVRVRIFWEESNWLILLSSFAPLLECLHESIVEHCSSHWHGEQWFESMPEWLLKYESMQWSFHLHKPLPSGPSSYTASDKKCWLSLQLSMGLSDCQGPQCVVIPVWSYQCGHTSVVIPVWSYQCGHTSVVIPVWSYQCGHTSVVIPVWSYQCGHTSEVIPVWSYQSNMPLWQREGVLSWGRVLPRSR